MEFGQRLRRVLGPFARETQTPMASRNGNATAPSTTGGQLASGLARPRHAGLFEALHRLDAGLSPEALRELTEWIREEYRSEYGDFPVGWLAVCGLGPPYVDHRLDLTMAILQHYTPGDVLPEPYARARILIRTGAYPLVEVYASGALVPVPPDGVVHTRGM
ncbi:hypothetical protein YW5DRAFT_03032 [Streptomyces sp. Ncost-T6T-1]|uniref:hypothetical protein n=1 Tax=Streptomyces sp. Ncost-T6T-1 TaxID=1100828 RepID=UPI0008055177|nr:hypothetical protein [Streptomyces sp. Ncost-T6T-1]SBV05632.1 hypothetical protein YW5DRAFT_03032 [Streptomyces sp. Ncost-T6T-1]